MKVCIQALLAVCFYIPQLAAGQSTLDNRNMIISNAQIFIDELRETAALIKNKSLDVERESSRVIKSVEYNIANLIRKKKIRPRHRNLSDSLNTTIFLHPKDYLLPENFDSVYVLLRLLEESPDFRGANIDYLTAGSSIQSIFDNLFTLKNKYLMIIKLTEQYHNRYGDTEISNELQRLKNESHRISIEITQYRQHLENSSIPKIKLLEVSRNMPAFKKYYLRHSMFASA